MDKMTKAGFFNDTELQFFGVEIFLYNTNMDIGGVFTHEFWYDFSNTF